ncbi:Caspase domain protein [Rubripirellula amarantea]|uniref:Caspase domain protein n=1 Tax=Rubripirellula amarantea TaxID=2527999 RepID=A0A5C5WMX8_9BACT|nr:caspase family protein [Rubripirellula amarantea]TWT51439.1 Caspase domain protein [Rubripirellula amarantea]
MPARHYQVTLLACLLTWFLPTEICVAQGDYSDFITSREKIGDDTPSKPTLKYRKQWALIVGIDYAEGDAYSNPKRREIPKLANARRDAAALKEKLINKYGYNHEDVVLLLEGEATGERINRELQKLHGNQVGDQDSVLVFFAGHGAKQTNVDGNVVVYPHDVELADGRTTSGMLYVRDDLITKINKSKALHKLLILDSCYSGEIFSQKLELAAPSSTDDGKDKSLFSQPGFQVIASCRGYQEASDGSGVNSPFALALLRGLEEIPSNAKQPPRIWTGRLMKTLDEEFRALDSSQRPSYRSLAGGQGEFTFFPDFDNAKFGDQSHGQLLSVAMLRATSPGVKGNWWFDEMPWFMPSIRGRILMENQAQSRSSDLLASIRPSSLRRIAGKVRDRMRGDVERLQKRALEVADPKAETESPAVRLLKLRSDHLTRLLKETDPAARLKTLESIEADLVAPENQDILEATDLHLLAVVRHSTGRTEAFDSYETAINRYQVPTQGDNTSGKLNKALEALCHADFGDCLSGLGTEPNDTIEQFKLAISTLDQTPPDAFHVYCLCRLSSTYLQDNRWEDARNHLSTAKDVVTDFDSESYLAAFVHRSDAWSKMIQWEIQEAESSFRESNAVLLPLIVENASPEARKAEQDAGLGERSIAFRQSSDLGAKVAYFHNLHGLAMAIRYRGKPQLAAQQYRRVIAMIEDALFQLRSVTDESSTRTEIELSLLGRFINSQERLGDCNLLGDPTSRDLAEAADDYRRAMSRVHRLPTTRRTNLKAQLFYKQALAFALPSPVQDCELAMEMCHHADEILTAEDKTSTGLLLALRTLTTPMVEMLAQATGQTQTWQTITSELDKAKAAQNDSASEKMRLAILTLRDLAGPSAHRDQLELMMFAARNLIEFGDETSRMRQSEDVELMLSLNRLALNRGNDSDEGTVHLGSQSFLRQYYDIAFAASLATTPNDAKRLLEIQYEATTGSRYGKANISMAMDSAPKSVPQPVLAIYRMENAAYLVCDCPRSKGSCIVLDDICTPDELVDACGLDPAVTMRLPSEVARKLETYFATVPTRCGISLHHRDPVSMLGYDYVTVTETSASFDSDGKPRKPSRPTTTQLRAIGEFPFVIPAQWRGDQTDMEERGTREHRDD